MGIRLNEQEKVDVAQGKALWDQRQEAKRKMNNEADPNKRAELQKDFETKDKAYSEYNSPEQRKLRAAQARGNELGTDKEAKANNEQKQEGDKISKTTENTTGKPSALSASFYRDFTAGLRNKPKGNTLDNAAVTSKTQSQNYKNESANRQMEAQASQQIANRNEYAEAGKVASMQNNAQNMQNINNLSAAAGNSAALQRKITTPDVQGQQARQDQQRNVANERREAADVAQAQASAASGKANAYSIKSRDYDQDLDKAHKLSMGEGTGSEGTAQSTAQSETQTQPEPKDNTPDTPTNNPDSQITGNPHHILNYVTYGDPKSMDDADRKLYEAWGSPQPLDEATVKAANGNLGVLQQNVMDMRPDFWKKYAESDIGKARGVGTANQRNIGNGLTRDELNNATQTVNSNDLNSDRRLKDILSDLKMKFIREDWDNDGHPSEEDFMWLLKRAGKFKNGDMEYDALEEGSDITDQEVLSGYADHIKNYVYNYKPEAEGLDPRNDPNVTHIGPMAQDIEQVNPACVNEDENGIKSVDTQRLAMMNAGAIGELARQLQDISDRLSKAGI